jgi:hypothetical protein
MSERLRLAAQRTPAPQHSWGSKAKDFAESLAVMVVIFGPPLAVVGLGYYFWKRRK